mmetsp:Transcript_34657/g.99932  ORF Transcript_34657/g.99932 Transcript_34657/m.99932 type:complete len:233 (+) Transcript_34657:244-942(+)
MICRSRRLSIETNIGRAPTACRAPRPRAGDDGNVSGARGRSEADSLLFVAGEADATWQGVAHLLHDVLGDVVPRQVHALELRKAGENRRQHRGCAAEELIVRETQLLQLRQLPQHVQEAPVLRAPILRARHRDAKKKALPLRPEEVAAIGPARRGRCCPAKHTAGTSLRAIHRLCRLRCLDRNMAELQRAQAAELRNAAEAADQCGPRLGTEPETLHRNIEGRQAHREGLQR